MMMEGGGLLSLKGSELRKEQYEFENLYSLNKQKQSEQTSKYDRTVVSSDMKNKQKQYEQAKQLTSEEKLGRTEVIEWKPHRILCKRFKLLDPFENKRAKQEFTPNFTKQIQFQSANTE